MRPEALSRTARVRRGVLAGTLLLSASCVNGLEEDFRSSSRPATADSGAEEADDCPAGSFAAEDAGCSPCPVGTYCEVGATESTPCVIGTWDDDADPATECTPWTNCRAGEYAMQEPSPTRDRDCVVCAPGSFTSEANAESCTSWTSCEAGTYVRIAGSTSRDQVCDDCPSGTYSGSEDSPECTEWQECSPGEYVAEAGSSVGDRLCTTCGEGSWSSTANAATCVSAGECEAGTVEVAPATDTTPADCLECEPGQYCAGGSFPAGECGATQWDHDEDPSTPCRDRSECEAGEYVTSSGSPLQDSDCEPCAEGSFSGSTDASECTQHQSCEPGAFLEMAGTAASDAVCTGCASGSFSVDQDAPTCTPWSDCEPGFFVAVVGSATEDRQCEPCPPNTYSTETNSGACVELGQCAPGSVQIAPGDDTNPAECEDCNPGEYCAGGEAEAVACGDGTWDDDVDPATPCAAKTSCVVGEYVTDLGDALTDRSCAACPDGHFSTTVDASACETWQTCNPGTYVASAGTQGSDRACEVCSAGTFSAVVDAPSCAAWTNCPAPTTYETTAPSTSVDRVCGSCTAPEETLEDNATACILPVFQMSGGTVVMEAENYHVQERNGSNHAWELTSVAAASGGACMDVNPDVAYTWTAPVGFAPRLDFRVDFSTTGTFYIHLRADAGSSGSGSDAGLASVDSTFLPDYDFDDGNGVWSWRQQSINVSTTGEHVVSVWAREDGLCVDKIVVSTSSTSPTGNGPAQSPEG